ncbi:MAG TPA: 50S ribosomal protein L3 [Candidatus Brocadiia bacterium]|nr:50S ribosomal protein L3 [Planctomycetota bacterium]MBI4008185.1 50S ribosomal protein L3 [Planctomycetota bacterium]MDO8092465.1 50S ribosomal protein L3 [Candidatus Brocadiales bacterium]
MITSLLGKKLGMSQMFTPEGELVPVTIIQAGPCDIMQIKTVKKDGYSALQVGFEDKKKKRATKPEISHAAKAGIGPKRFIRELPCENDSQYKPGQKLTVDVFNGISLVDIIGVNKGKGFAGVMKRWGFKGGRATHGSTRHRCPGSIGSNTDPGRVIKGMRMAGRLGGKRCTLRNIRVVKIDSARNLLFVKGSVPGYNGAYLYVRKSKSLKGEK